MRRSHSIVQWQLTLGAIPAARLYVMHNTEQIWLPPPEPGIVAATLAPNDRLALLARGCAGAGEVVRVRQPIDLSQFSPRGWASAQPSKILLLGNYSEMPGQRVDQLKQACLKKDLSGIGSEFRNQRLL